MKQLLFSLGVLALVVGLAACTPETAEELYADSEMNPTELQASAVAAKKVKRPLKITTEGTLSPGDGLACEGLFQIDILGTGQASHLGNMDIAITLCTNFAGVSMQTGVQTAANGDELYFYAFNGGVVDEHTVWADYRYYGGTGRFTEVEGEVRMYITRYFTAPATGTFTNTGSGWLAY